MVKKISSKKTPGNSSARKSKEGFLLFTRSTSSIKHFIMKHERQLFVAGLLFGFVWDNLTLRRIDLFYENLVLLLYLLVAGTTIILIYISQSPNRIPKLLEKWSFVLPLASQIAFGALFSAFVVFYVRGSVFAVSWIFIFALGALLIGNEFFRKRYYKISFQVSLFYIALFSYLIFAVPIVIGKIGAFAFSLSAVLSLILIFLFVRLLLFIAKTPGHLYVHTIRHSVGTIFVAIILLYFANIIPPLPLSLKAVEVAHSVERVGSGYAVEVENHPWYILSQYFRTTFHRTPGESISVFSSIFSPTDLDTNIVHHWQSHNGKKWVSRNKISFHIIGGRDGGYRGYTTKSNVEEGLWRVDVETPSGQVIGRETFTVKNVPESVDTTSEKF